MTDHKNNVIRPLLSRWVLLTVVVYGVGCFGGVAYLLRQSLRLVLSQQMWRVVRPSGYCMDVAEETTECRWHTCVDGRHVIHASGLPSECERDDLDMLTVEQLFLVAKNLCLDGQCCAGLSCTVEYDPRFNYPVSILIGGSRFIQVKQFTPCEVLRQSSPCPEFCSKSSCSPGMPFN
jgi:hypothetical protein